MQTNIKDRLGKGQIKEELRPIFIRIILKIDLSHGQSLVEGLVLSFDKSSENQECAIIFAAVGVFYALEQRCFLDKYLLVQAVL